MRPGLLKRAAAAVLALALVLPLTACGGEDTAETSLFAMDTVMSLTVTGKDSQEALDRAVEELYRLDKDFTVTASSPIFDLNNAAGEWVPMKEDDLDLLKQGLELCRLTGGALDLTAYSAVRAWGFTTGDYRVPDREELAELAAHIDYTALELDEENSAARLPKGMAADLGSVAKGYAADRLGELLRADGVQSGLLDLGSSTMLALGTKPSGDPWRIGIRTPGGNDYLAVLELEDLAMGTSGGYQRYFERDGVTYWHIIDPTTAAPARTGLGSVTVVSPSGLLCDGLSTALFVMGEKQALQFWRSHPELDFDVLFVRKDGSVTITSGLESRFEKAPDHEKLEVRVVR